MAKAAKLDTGVRFRDAFDSEVLGWPDVTTRKMFGCPCYLARGKMFSFFVTDGLVLTNLSADAWNDLAEVAAMAPFEYGGKVITGWAHVDISGMPGPGPLMESVRASYEGALKKAGAEVVKENQTPRRRTRRTGS
ncbi:MAG: hypothetical protein HZC51_05300 [Nitrospirae bacterium]|nr:hypothetical protein [Nitrospirota bacterium]